MKGKLQSQSFLVILHFICRWDTIYTTSVAVPKAASPRPSSGCLKSSRRAKSSSPSQSKFSGLRIFILPFNSREPKFVCRFRDAPVEALRADVRLYSALQEHALRVMQVVEKVIARLDNQEKVRTDKEGGNWRPHPPWVKEYATSRTSQFTETPPPSFCFSFRLLALPKYYGIALLPSMSLHIRRRGHCVCNCNPFHNPEKFT